MLCPQKCILNFSNLKFRLKSESKNKNNSTTCNLKLIPIVSRVATACGALLKQEKPDAIKKIYDKCCSSCHYFLHMIHFEKQPKLIIVAISPSNSIFLLDNS